MSIKEKSARFAAVIVALIVILLLFAVEQFNEVFGLGWNFHPANWMKSLFMSKTVGGNSGTSKNVDWDAAEADLKDFSNWAEGLADANISIVRPDAFQIERADRNPATKSRFSWNLLLVSKEAKLNAAQIEDKLKLICEPEEKVKGRLMPVKRLNIKDKEGFSVMVDNVSGEGKMGLSYAGGPPTYYDVKLRSLWLVPVASCRSAMKGRYDSAVFFPGIEKGLSEGSVISPSGDKCGYRILSVSDHCVWFEAFYEDMPTEIPLPYNLWPDFSRIENMPFMPSSGRLVFGKNRYFWQGDAIKLRKSGLYLMVDELLDRKAVVFRLLDSAMRPLRELLCVIVREKK